MENKKVRIGTDFSGVGAFDQALIRLGVDYEKVFACDYNYYARKTYILNFGTEEDLVLANSKEHKMFCDGMESIILGKTEEKSFINLLIKLNFSGDDLETKIFNFSNAADEFANRFSFYYPFNVYDRQIPEESLDDYVTTPPCQSFSLAGKRLGKDDKRGILFFNSLEFIDKNRPRRFYFENVKGLLSDDKTNDKAQYGNTFQEWVNYLGGKSINGVPTIFPYEDSVPYHIYFKVMNAKEHGVPQNRERIFIIGIRDDEENDFQFPKTIPLEKRLKDVLESNVDEKYFLSDEMVEKLMYDNGKEFINQNTQASQVHDTNGVFPTLCAGTHGYASGYVKDEIIQLNDPVHSNDRIYSEEGISPTLNTMQGGNRQPFVQVSAEVIQLNQSKESGGKQPYQTNRIYDINGISPDLDTDSGGRKNILVEEYKIGAIRGRNPTNLKSRKPGLETVQMLEINENGVSNALTTVQKDNVVVITSNTKKGYEKAEEEEDSINFSVPNSKTRRGRVGKGVAQTLDTSCSQGVFTKQRIRRLTPTECFRLMNFNPEMIEKTISSGLISDSQLYKQAGNSVVVKHFVDLYSKLNLK